MDTTIEEKVQTQLCVSTSEKIEVDKGIQIKAFEDCNAQQFKGCSADRPLTVEQERGREKKKGKERAIEKEI